MSELDRDNAKTLDDVEFDIIEEIEEDSEAYDGNVIIFISSLLPTKQSKHHSRCRVYIIDRKLLLPRWIYRIIKHLKSFLKLREQ